MSSGDAATSAPVDAIVLLPCPFCGGEVKWIEHDGDFCHGGGILCNGSGCMIGGEIIDGFGNSRERAVYLWNRRDGDRCRHECVIDRAVPEFSESLE